MSIVPHEQVLARWITTSIDDRLLRTIGVDLHSEAITQSSRRVLTNGYQIESRRVKE